MKLSAFAKLHAAFSKPLKCHSASVWKCPNESADCYFKQASGWVHTSANWIRVSSAPNSHSRRLWPALYGAGTHISAVALLRFAQEPCASFGSFQVRIQPKIQAETVNEDALDSCMLICEPMLKQCWSLLAACINWQSVLRLRPVISKLKPVWTRPALGRLWSL